MSKPKKSGSPAKKRTQSQTASAPKDALRISLANHARAQQSIRLIWRMIAWLMQHRDAWDATEAKIPITDLDADVDVGFVSEDGYVVIVPAPPMYPDAEMDAAMAAAAARLTPPTKEDVR